MKKMQTYACALVLSGFIGYAFGQGVSHLEASIENMNMAIKEAIHRRADERRDISMRSLCVSADETGR